MLSTVTAIAMGLLPPTMGALSLYGVFRRQCHQSWAAGLIAVGVGAYCGPVIMALMMSVALNHGLNPLTVWMVIPAMAVVGLGWGLGSWSVTTAHPTPLKESAPQPPTALVTGMNIALAAWLLLIVAWVCFEAAHRPVIAWDAVWGWGVHANTQISLALGASPALVDGTTHPVTVIQILTWGAYWAGQTPTKALLLSPWAGLYLGWVLVSLGLARRLGSHWTGALGVALVLASAPMVESHAVLGGYADLWLASGLVFGLAVVLGLSDTPSRLPAWAVGLAVIISAAWIKNNGLLYVAIVSLALLMAGALTGRHWRWGLAGVGVLAGALAWVLLAGLEVELAGVRLVYLPDEGVVGVNNRVGAMSEAGLDAIVHNLWQAWWASSSYGVVFGVALMVLPVAAVRGLMRRDFAAVSLALAAIGFVLFFALAQSASAYFYQFARPQFDTGLTRFSQALFWLAVMAGWATLQPPRGLSESASSIARK